jgi:hypothetical protein
MIAVLPKISWYLTTLIIGTYLQVIDVTKDGNSWNVLFQNCPGNVCGKRQDINIATTFKEKPIFKRGNWLYFYKGTELQCMNIKKVEEHDLPFWVTRDAFICNYIKGEFNYYDEKGNPYTIKHKHDN